MRKKQANELATNEPIDIDVEDFAVELTASDADNDERQMNITVNDNATTFPLTRTFTHCDPTGRELAHVTVTATVTLTRINGVTLTLYEIERRFRRNFYLSFKGGKASGVSGTGVEENAATTRPRRTMSLEHKQKLQEARQRRSDIDNTASRRARIQTDEASIIRLATVLLDGLSHEEWFGKTDVLYACGPMTVEPTAWTLAIRYLLDTKQIEARGEKRGREYRRVNVTK